MGHLTELFREGIYSDIKINKIVRLSFKDFFLGNFDDAKYNLYIVAKDDVAVYIETSRLSVYNKWFGSFGHLPTGIGGVYGTSDIGREIAENGMENYEVLLFIIDSPDVYDAEIDFIKQLRPKHNVSYSV